LYDKSLQGVELKVQTFPKINHTSETTAVTQNKQTDVNKRPFESMQVDIDTQENKLVMIKINIPANNKNKGTLYSEQLKVSLELK